MSNIVNFPNKDEVEMAGESVDQVTQEYLDAIHSVVSKTDELKKNNKLAEGADAAPNVVNDNPKGLEMEEVVVQKNLLTGQTTQLGTKADYNFEEKESVYNIGDILAGKVPETIDEAISMNPTEVKSQIKDELGNITDEEAAALMDLVMLYQKDSNLSNMFSRLPEGLQKNVRTAMMQNGIQPTKKMFEMYTEHLLTNIISGIKIDRFQVELDTELRKVTSEGSPELIAVIKAHLRGDAERFKAVIESQKEKGETEAAAKLETLVAATYDATHFITFKKALSERSIKAKKFDVEKPERVLKYFDGKFERSTYNIKSIYCIPAVLDRILEKDVSGKVINLFTILFAKMCENMKVSNPADYAMMYYTVSTITYLEVSAPDDDEFNAEKERVIDDIKECLKIIEEKYANLL